MVKKPASQKKHTMKPSLRKSALSALPIVLSITSVIQAEDLSFSGANTVRLLALDWADYLGGSGSFNAGVNDGGRLYWRGTAGDGQFIHFNLSRLSGLTMLSPASVTLQNTNDTYGGGVTDSYLATANNSWSASYGSALPGATAVVDATNATGSYPSNTSVSWSLGATGFQNLVDNAASFHGFGIIGGPGSQMHFNGPLNPYLDVETNGSMSNVVSVAGGAAWNASNYTFTHGVLTINDAIAGGTEGAGAVTIRSLGTVFVNGNSGDNRYWAIDSTSIQAGGQLMLQGHSHLHNLTLSGGELAGIRPNGSWGGWTFDDATVVTGTAISTISAQQINLDNGSFAVDSGSTLLFTGSIRGGSMTKSGGGSLVISGNNGSSGGITINGGTFTATKSAQDDSIHTLGYGPLTVNNGGTLRTTQNWTTSSEWNGNSVGTVTINQGGTWSIEALGQTIKNGLNLNGGSITSTTSNADWGALQLKSDLSAGGGVISSISADTAINWTRTFTVETDSQLNYSGVIHNQYSTNGGINKAGSGTLVLSGANGYSGQTDIIAGTLLASSNTALGVGGHNGQTMSWVRDGATLALQGGISLDEHFHLWGSGVGGLGSLRSISGNNALTNAPSDGAGYCLRSNATVRVDADTLTVSGFYEAEGSFGLNKTGAGTLKITKVSTYTGPTTVEEGTLSLDATGGSGRIRGSLTIGQNGVVETTGDGTGLGWNGEISSLAINGGTLTSAGVMHIWGISGDVIMTGGLLQSNNGTSDPSGSVLEWNRTNVTTLASTESAEIAGRIRIRADGGFGGIQFQVANGDAAEDLVISAAITEASAGMGITKNGAGTMTLRGTNSYSGSTTVNQGTLVVGNGTTTSNLDNGSLVSVTTDATLTLDYSGSDEVGSLVIDGIDQGSGTFNATTHPGVLTGSGSLLVLANDGVWTAESNGNWGTQANWQNGGVAAGQDKTASFVGAAGTTVTLDSNRSIGGLVFSTLDYTITGSSRTLTLDALNGSSIAVAEGSSATINSRLSSSGSVTKTGSGTLKLYAANGDNYSGAYYHNLGGLEIQSGTVELNSQFITLGQVNIAAGATLLATVPWATGSSNPWFNGRTIGAITVQKGGTLSSSTIANSIVSGLTLLGGSVTSNHPPSNDWGHFIIASSVYAEGDETSTISAEIALPGARNFYVAGGSALVMSGPVHDRYGADPGAVIKSGDGAMTLSATNAYSGNTTVQAGTLVLGNGTTSSNLTDTADVSLSSGATLHLDFIGTDTIDELFLDGVAKSPGAYNASNSGGFITGTGSLVVSNGPISDPLLGWIDATWPDLADKTPSGDPDNDGLPNLLEFVLKNGDPAASNPAILPTISASGDNFVFTFYRRNATAAETTQTFEYGTGLDAWSSITIPGGNGVTVTDQGNGIDQVEVAVPKGSNTSMFGRLKVVK